ncbi:hypothetical protein NS2_49180 [Nocardia seriolae NBRC 15557]|nr:hypothetical protein NS2_49180 [Nocardia seriolae NBRC 15557]
MPAIAQQQQPGLLATEELARHGVGRERQESRQPGQLRNPHVANQSDGVPNRMPTTESRFQQWISKPPPLRQQFQPGPGIVAMMTAQFVDGALRIRIQGHRVVRRTRRGEHGRRMGPPQPVIGQTQPAQHGRDNGHRMIRAVQIRPETVEQLRGPDRATELGLLLENQHLPPGIGQQIRGDQAVVSGSYDDSVEMSSHAIDPTHPGSDPNRAARWTRSRSADGAVSTADAIVRRPRIAGGGRGWRGRRRRGR